MPIRFPQAAPQIRASFANAANEGLFPMEAVPGAAFLEDIHQVYYVSPDALTAEAMVAAARPVSWRRNTGTVGMPSEAEIDIKLNAANTAITSVSEGPFSQAPMRQLNDLAGEGSPEDDFELRMLRVPELRLMAIWLHGKERNVVIPLSPCPSELKPGQRYTLENLAEAMKPAIKRLADHPADQEG